MLQEASDIATSTPDPFDGGCPADTVVHISGIVLGPHKVHTGQVLPFSDEENMRLRAENIRLKTAIREADASIKRMLGEIDAMVAKLMEAGK